MIPWYFHLEFQITMSLLVISSVIIISDKINRK